MSKYRWCAGLLALAAGGACTFDAADVDGEARKKPHTSPDAAVATPIPDAPSPSASGTVSCYSEGAPDRLCASPDHCCFSNYTAQHNGYCTTDRCTWGMESCDGAEDCGSGQSCCGVRDEFGWTLACSSSCEAANEELCHPGDTCKNGGTCVSAYGLVYDLPRTLWVCR